MTKESDNKIVVSAIFFDIGDTLIDVSKIMEQALRETADYLENKDIIPNKEEFIETYKTIDQEIQGPKINHLFSDLKIIKKTIEKLKFSSSLSLIGTFIGVYRSIVRRNLRKNERLIKFFNQLKKDGYKIAIITDGTTVEQMEQLYKLGIIEYIDILITSEELGVEKPNEYIFKKALSYLSIADSYNAVMVGDDLERDIRGAKSVGIKTILVTKYSRKNKIPNAIQPDIIVDSVFDILRYIHLWRYKNE
jgi:putative hydrolase of the HAD superfamily